MHIEKYKTFNYLENGDVNFSPLQTLRTTSKLDSNSYNISYVGYPVNSVTLNTNTEKENINIFKFSEKENIDSLISAFFSVKVKDKIRKLGLYNKFGILLYGKEGTGKTSIIKHYCNELIYKHNALVFYISYSSYEVRNIWEFIVSIRRLQDNPIVVIFEEVDEQIDKNNEPFLKSLLDGHLSIDNCIFLLSTNYIDKIPDSIKNRASRIKYCINVAEIDDIEYTRDIISNLLGDLLTPDELENLAHELNNNTLDIIKDKCIDIIMNIKNYKGKSKKKIGFSK